MTKKPTTAVIVRDLLKRRSATAADIAWAADLHPAVTLDLLRQLCASGAAVGRVDPSGDPARVIYRLTSREPEALPALEEAA